MPSLSGLEVIKENEAYLIYIFGNLCNLFNPKLIKVKRVSLVNKNVYIQLGGLQNG